LNEEVGELNAAFLAMKKIKNMSNSSISHNPELHFLEEASDALICIFDVVYKAGFVDDDIQNMIAKKTKKWEAKLG